MDFVVTNAGKTDIKSLRVGELQDQLREQVRLQTKREFSCGALPVSHSAARVGRRRVIYSAVKDCPLCHQKALRVQRSSRLVGYG